LFQHAFIDCIDTATQTTGPYLKSVIHKKASKEAESNSVIHRCNDK